jgi:hypothetical protein
VYRVSRDCRGRAEKERIFFEGFKSLFMSGVQRTETPRHNKRSLRLMLLLLTIKKISALSALVVKYFALCSNNFILPFQEHILSYVIS